MTIARGKEENISLMNLLSGGVTEIPQTEYSSSHISISKRNPKENKYITPPTYVHSVYIHIFTYIYIL